MRFRFGFLALAMLLLSGLPAGAATIYTFSVQGTADFDTDAIHSFSFDSGTATFAFVKDLDGTSPAIFAAVAQGDTFTRAEFLAYDTSVAPTNEMFRYTFAGNVQFSSVSYVALTEMVSLTAEEITRTDGPAAAAEPALMLLLGTALLGVGVRRWKQGTYGATGRLCRVSSRHLTAR